MGNKAIIERIASARNVSLVSKFNVEELIDDSLIDAISSEFSTQSGVSIEGSEEEPIYKQDFTEFNAQKNEFLSDLIKDRVIKEINEAITTGFSTPDFFLEELKEPRYEKYFQVKEKGSGGDYFSKQYKKFFILYLYYKIKTQDLEVSKKDFYESLNSLFENNTTSEEFFNFESGMRFSLSMMKELGKTNPNFLITSLKSLYQSFITAPCELRRKVNKFDFYAEEELFNEFRTFMVKLIEDKNSTPAIQELCLKLIILIGNSRGSGEDYLIVYNLIDQHGFEFNLDDVLSQCKFVESKGKGADGEEETLKVSYEGSSSGHILKGGDSDLDFNSAITLTTDNEFMYAYQTDKGLFKLGFKNSIDTKLGTLYKKNSGMSEAHRYFMFFQGKLYCRSKNSDKKPFVLIDTETLQEITDDEEFNKKIEALTADKPEEEADKKDEEKIPDDEEEEKKEDEKPKTPVLEWTKEEDDDEEKKSGRYLCESPLFTDGHNIYVISTRREVKVTKKEEDPELEEDKKDLVISRWNVEIYDGETWQFKDSIDLKLDIKQRGLDEVISDAEEKETDNIKKLRESFSMAHIANCSFATNGHRLLVGENKNWHIFDMKERKWTFNLNLTSNFWGFDYMTNTFWEITSEGAVKSFKIPSFRRIETGESSSKGIIEYINSKAEEIQHLQTMTTKIGKTSAQSLFKNLLKKAEDQAKTIQYEVKTKPEYTKFLIMNILKEGSKDLITLAESVIPQRPVDNEKLNLFRGSYSTSVSTTFFTELLNAVEKSCPLLLKKEKKSSNLLEQYDLYMQLILLRTSMMCLSKLNISLSTVLEDKRDFARFLSIVEDKISVIVSKEKPDYTIEEGKANAELQALWKAIQNECRNIMAFCLSLVYESLGDLMKKVTTSLDKLEIGEIDNSLGIYIEYLTLPETMNKALRDNDIKELILIIYEKLCDKKTKKLIYAIESVKYENHNLRRLTYNSLEENSEGFIYSVTQNIINQYFESYRDLEKEKEKDKSDKDKVEKLERKLEKTELDLIKVLERISESTIQILETCSTATKYYLDEALKQQKEDEKIEEEDKKPKKTGKDKYVEFHRFIYKVAKENNNFTKLMHVYVAAFASLKDSLNVKTLSLLSVKILKVIETFSKYSEIKHDDLTISEDEDLFRQYLNKDVMKFFVWTISKLSYSFINVKKVTELSEEEKMNKKILDSKLLSGGIENRFLNILSKDTVNSLRDLCEITGDTTIKSYLNNKPEELDEDQIYYSIIHKGKDENADRVIDLLQYDLERKHIWAKTGKEEGERLSRAAFSCMLKIANLYTDFIMMMDETEMNMETAEGKNEEETRKNLSNELKKMDPYEDIFKRYESAARMRSWYQEKKKSWANKVKKEEDEKKKKEEKEAEDKKDEDKKEEKKEDKKEEAKEDKKEDEEEEIIDTSGAKKDDQSPKKKTKDQIELAKIVEKIIEKAELLIKCSMPTSWGSTHLPLLDNPSEKDLREKEEDEVAQKGDWITKLKTWKERQVEGTIAGDEKANLTAIFNSSSQSILAALQSPISAQRIKKQIETIYLNALKRICGFRLIARLSYMDHSSDTRTEYLNWFCSSLRHNTNLLTHYTHDVTGCGEHLNNELRKSFFLVFNGIVKQLKECTDEEEIKFLIN